MAKYTYNTRTKPVQTKPARVSGLENSRGGSQPEPLPERNGGFRTAFATKPKQVARA